MSAVSERRLFIWNEDGIPDGIVFALTRSAALIKLRRGSVFRTPGYAPFRQIVRAYFEFNVVAFDNSDVI